jgi:hypothetical protein
MAQHDYTLADAPPLSVRSEFNSMLSAILSNNSGPLSPSVKYPGMTWYKSDTGVMAVLMTNGSTWSTAPVDVAFLPITGGTVAALTVNGAFSNPDYDKAKGSYIGATSPTNPLAGMLWYDTSVTPNVLRIRNPTNAAWLLAVDIATPVFQEAVNITGTTARVSFVSGAQTRWMANDPTGNRITFQLSTGALALVVTDAGNMGLGVHAVASLAPLINAKQAALGFTPIRQNDAVVTAVGNSPPHVYRNGVDQGQMQFGAAPNSIVAALSVGAVTHASAVNNVVPNGTCAASNLKLVASNAVPSAGTYRQLGADTSNLSIYQRIA